MSDQQAATSRNGAASELRFEDVSRVYRGVVAVDRLSFLARPGEILALVGPSGCGKTTALRIAAGVERPSAGRVFLDGEEVAGDTVHVPPEKRGVGLMFQDFALFPHLTVEANVRFGLAGLPAAERSRRAGEALERVGLAGRAASYPHMLSGGEQQRVALARALAPNPGVLLMDEPFSNLDGRMRDEVREGAIEIIRESGGTAVIVTHDPEEALRVADRIVLMRAGRLAQEGAGDELYLRPASIFAARFFCQLNEIPAQVRGGVAESALGRFPAAQIADGPATLCLRPSAVSIRSSGDGADGRVLSRRFLGEVDFYEVSVAGLDRPLVARLRPGESGYGKHVVGEAVKLHLREDDVLVFAASDA